MDRTKRSVARARACRNLFGDCVGSGVSPSDETIAEEKRREFYAKWGFDVNTDTVDPNSPWEWESVDYEDVPDVFRRIGGTRSRRYSGASIDSGDDAYHSRSSSFSMPNADDDRRRMRTPELPSDREMRLSSDSSLYEANSSLEYASPRALITDYLRSQAKRSRTAKETSDDSLCRSPEMTGH